MISPRQIASVQSANEEEKKGSKSQKEMTNPDKYRVLSWQNEPVRHTSNSRHTPLGHRRTK